MVTPEKKTVEEITAKSMKERDTEKKKAQNSGRF